MYKTRLGVTAGVLGAAIYFGSFFGGLTVAVLLAGYTLLCEQNDWLRYTAIKAILLTILFALVPALLNLIPNIIGFVDDICNIFNGSFSVVVMSRIVTALNSLISLVEKVLFILLGVTALRQGNINVPVVDNMVRKYMGM